MEQEDLDYFERRFDRLENSIATKNKEQDDRLNVLEKTSERHGQVFAVGSALGLAGFTAWISTLFHK